MFLGNVSYLTSLKKKKRKGQPLMTVLNIRTLNPYQNQVLGEGYLKA